MKIWLRRVILLLRKDLLRQKRSPLGVLAMIAFPLLFAGMIGLAFGGEQTLPRARLLVEDRDGSLAGQLILGALGSEQVEEFIDAVEVGDEGQAMIEKGEASALLRLPEDLTEKLFDGEPVTLELYRNPAESILPEIAEQTLAVLVDLLDVAAGLVSRQVDSLGIEDLEEISDADVAAMAVAFRRTGDAAWRYVDTPPLTLSVVDLDAEDEAEEEEEEDTGNDATTLIFLFVLPGISVYSLFVIGDQMMRDVLTESRLGTLRRQLHAPIDAGQIIAAKVLATLLVASFALLILAAIARFLARSPVDPLGTAALSLALILAIAGFAATIYGLAKTDRQGGTFAAVLYLFMAFSGGAFMPVDNLPPALARLSPLSPFYWGTTGFQELLNGGGLAEVWRAILVLGSLGIVLLICGALFLDRRLRHGDLA